MVKPGPHIRNPVDSQEVLPAINARLMCEKELVECQCC